jgi:hypothetical protein
VLGETYAKFEFFEKGWNPYTRFLDLDKVDLILRRRTTTGRLYREISGQVQRTKATSSSSRFVISTERSVVASQAKDSARFICQDYMARPNAGFSAG